MPDSPGRVARFRSRLSGTAAQDLPGDYEIRCDCGRKSSGTRRDSWKQTVCEECHTVLYVLPTNVYPATPQVASEVIAGPFSKRLRVLLAEAVARPEKAVRKNEAAVRNPESDDDNSSESTHSPRRWSIPQPPSLNPLPLIRRTFTPLRLLVLGMVLVVSVAMWAILIQQRQEQAREQWHQSVDAVKQLLAESDFAELSQQLQLACTAGRTLQLETDQWRQTWNLLGETEALLQQNSRSLPELLSRAGRKTRLDEETLRQLKADLQSGCFIVDGYVDASGSTGGHWLIDLPTMSAAHPVEVRLHLPELQPLHETLEEPRFVFAFRVSDVTRPTETHPWQIQVAPSEFVLLTSPQHCAELGLLSEPSDEVHQVLQRQQDFISQSVSWERRRHPVQEQIP